MMMMINIYRVNIKSSSPVYSVEISTIHENFCMEFYTAVKQ